MFDIKINICKQKNASPCNEISSRERKQRLNVYPIIVDWRQGEGATEFIRVHNPFVQVVSRCVHSVRILSIRLKMNSILATLYSFVTNFFQKVTIIIIDKFTNNFFYTRSILTRVNLSPIYCIRYAYWLFFFALFLYTFIRARFVYYLLIQSIVKIRRIFLWHVTRNFNIRSVSTIVQSCSSTRLLYS